MTYLNLGGQSDTRVTVRITPVFPAEVDEVADRLQREWSTFEGLAGAALLRSLEGDALVEYLQWDEVSVLLPTSEGGTTMEGVSDSYIVGDAHENASASIDAENPGIALVALIRCKPSRQRELLELLTAAAEHFKTLYSGWRGALLHPATSGEGIIEYNQFDSLEAMLAAQTIPEVAAHIERVATFGDHFVAVAVPIAVQTKQ